MDRAERIAKARTLLRSRSGGIHFEIPPGNYLIKDNKLINNIVSAMSSVSDTKPVAKFSPTVTILKTNKPQNQVFGWASVAFTADGQVEDHEGHLIDADVLEKAAYSFNFREPVSNDQHRSEPFGRMIESMVFTPEKIAALNLPSDFPTGWWVGMELPPDRYQSVVSGERPMLSIEGTANLEPFAA